MPLHTAVTFERLSLLVEISLALKKKLNSPPVLPERMVLIKAAGSAVDVVAVESTNGAGIEEQPTGPEDESSQYD
eukprot:CAMPEP_0115042922 /NCGR_PEP_ID=MMETSP0216-20121206/46556_1 /TAXON_ID=223996 /ORGANISM="Protocruzia adherens, Strain Boccale" /LENGTH=74 /DNA_ID=CAMNT_0002425133 /DNA_START=211 /DNA_END=434 /DNA_ORIENTATION=-